MRAVTFGQLLVVALAPLASALPAGFSGPGQPVDAPDPATAHPTTPEPVAMLGPASESRPLGPAPVDPVVAGGSRRDGLSEGTLGGTLRTVFALAFVLGLAMLAAAALKRLAKGRGGLLGALGPGGPSPSGVMEILGRYPVGPGQSLVLLKLDRRVLLLHQSTARRNAHMRTLAELTDPDEVASILMRTRPEADEAVQNGFREAMRRLERDFSAFDTPAPSAGPGARIASVGPDVDRAELLAVGGQGAGGDHADLRARLRRWIGEGRG